MSDCPHPDGPFHFWEVDGPNTVSCVMCGADGIVQQTTEGREDYGEEEGLLKDC